MRYGVRKGQHDGRQASLVVDTKVAGGESIVVAVFFAPVEIREIWAQQYADCLNALDTLPGEPADPRDRIS